WHAVCARLRCGRNFFHAALIEDHCHIRSLGIGDDLDVKGCRAGWLSLVIPRAGEEGSPSTYTFLAPPPRPRAEIAYSLSPTTTVAAISPTRMPANEIV